MAALTSPLPQFQSPFNVPAGTLPPARTGAENSLLLAQQDPMFPKFLNAMRGNPEFSGFTDAAIANLFHLPGNRELLLGSPIHNPPMDPGPQIPPADMDFTREAVAAQKEKAGTSPISRPALEGPYFADQTAEMYQSPSANGALTTTQEPPPQFQSPFHVPAGTLPPATPALATGPTTAALTPNDNNNGALFSKTANNAATAAQSYTGNQRGSNLPDMKIGRGERLMRMGIAGLAAGGLGGDKQLAAMGAAYTDVNAENRAAEMGTFKIEEERRQAHAARVAALAASKNKGAGGGGGDEVNAVRGAMSKLQTALDMFDADTDSSLSGFNWRAITSRVFGRAFGNEDEAKRLFLNELRLDSIMRRIKDTKGAISNAEMDLFSKDSPTMNSNDIVWTSWIKRQLQMQQIILNRVQAGQRIDPDAPITETMPNLDTGGGGSTGKEVLFTAPTGGKVFAK